MGVDLDFVVDYVPLVETLLDSDEPLTSTLYVTGETTPPIVLGERENPVSCNCFEGNFGVHASLDEASSPLDIFSCFFTKKLLQKNKQARRGLKVYKLCSSDGPEAGYMLAFKIYMG